MFDLIETELTRLRRIAEQTDDGFLLYLIDIAIMEANVKARSSNNRSLPRDDRSFAQNSARRLQNGRGRPGRSLN